MIKLLFLLLILLNSLIINTRCARPTECELPFATGPCRAMFSSFYFNPSTNQCEEFVYGGCDGNANRFENKEECLARCGGNNHQNEILHQDE
ncbi:unnamed protein product [Adineta steineri]|uniref:BPTI/Kunitz inhibitor domain-containing protein n=1 Tax=Adineta steineri TaxID=433720 RepID=A0A819S865_9BILA|nr:unnamed protein product [Adineta steineri]CAF4055090.1 unnamed protein product [Adineta steineri]